MSKHYLKALFDPNSIVVIGASETENTDAAFITQQLNKFFTKDLYFVNPKHQLVLGKDCYKKVKNIEQDIDLAIVVSPSKSVEKVIRECAAKGIPTALIMTKIPIRYKSEMTANMKSLNKIADELGIRILGPNATALVRTSSGLNALFSDNKILSGGVALISRSASICNTIVDWAETEQIGFSSIISRDTVVDVDLADILDFLASDYRTTSIIIYLNQIKDSRRFMSALKAATKLKPVVVLKTAHDNGGYCDAISKTAEVYGMDDVFKAAVLRAGADHVSTLINLYAAAKILSSKQRTKGDRLGIISNGYGPVMLANDRLFDLKIKPVTFSPSLTASLKATSETLLSCDNAVVIYEKENIAELYAKNIQLLLSSKEVDSVAIFLAPDSMVENEKIALEISKVIKSAKKPVLVAWLGTDFGGQLRKILINANVSNYRTPEVAVDAFSFLNHHYANRQRLLQVPFPLKKKKPPNLYIAKEIIKENLANKRNVLSKGDSISLLEAFHINCNPSRLAESETDALCFADEIGYPVALKIDSQNITYKSDLAGVKLNISNPESLKKAYQQIKQSIWKLPANIEIDGIRVDRMYTPASGRVLKINIINDPAFGPIISFGPGGTPSPTKTDRAIQLPPLNRRLSEDLINATQVSLILDKYRNLPAANREKLREVLIRVSEIATYLPQVFELTLNPIILDEHEAVINDVRVVIQKASSDSKHYKHLAIHPYPSNWHRHITIKKNKKVEVRPIRAEDAQQVVDFVKNMSKESKYFRFMHVVNELTLEMISNFTKFDYDREMAFGAFIQKKKQDKLIGMSRYSINPDKQSCEFAITVDDNYHGMGLAKQLMLILIEHVKDQDLKTIEGTVLKNNDSMNKLMSSLGFVKHPSKEDYDINIFTFEFDS